MSRARTHKLGFGLVLGLGFGSGMMYVAISMSCVYVVESYPLPHGLPQSYV